MKQIIFFAALLLCAGEVLSQSRYYMRYDSVYFERGGGNSELILRNGTRDSTGGILTNIWGGRTAFMKTRLSGDSLFIGIDTFFLGRLDTAINVGGGIGVFRERSGDSLIFKSITNGFGFDLTEIIDESEKVIEIHAAVDTNEIATQTDLSGNTFWQLNSTLLTPKSNYYIKVQNPSTSNTGFSDWPYTSGTLSKSAFGVYGKEPSIDILIDSSSTLQTGNISFRSNKITTGGTADKFPRLPSATFGANAYAVIQSNAFRNPGNAPWTSTIEFYLGDSTGTNINVPFAASGPGNHFFGNRIYHTAEAKEALYFATAINRSSNFAFGSLNTFFAGNLNNLPAYFLNAPIIAPDTTTNKAWVINTTTGAMQAMNWPATGGGGGGSVTDFAFTDGSGFDGTVTSSTSTPTLSLTTTLASGSVPIIGASGALTEDNTNFYFDNTNNRLGLGTTAPTHPLTLAQTQAFSGATLYKTTDQVTNFGRGNIRMRSSGTTPIMEYDIQTGGTVTGGYHSFMVAGVEKLAVDAAQATFSGNFFFSPDATHDIGRLSGSPFRPRNLYLSGSAQFGAPANTSIARQLHVVTQNAVTNAITNLARFAHMTSGTAAAGSGVGIEFEAENAAGTQIITGSITNPYTTATAGSEAAELAFNVVSSGSSSERLRLGQYLSTPTGTTSRSARHGGVVWNTISTVSTSGTSETDLHTRTTEASVLAADGEWIEWKSIGILNPGNTENGATITIRAYWAGTEVFETAATAPAAAVPYTITVRVQRMSSSSAMVTTEISGGGFSITLVSPAIVNVTTTFSNTNILKVTGETTDADQALNSITSEFKWFPTNQ